MNNFLAHIYFVYGRIKVDYDKQLLVMSLSLVNAPIGSVVNIYSKCYAKNGFQQNVQNTESGCSGFAKEERNEGTRRRFAFEGFLCNSGA